MGRRMKVVVDFNTCEENALCMGIAPEVFDVQDDGLHLLTEEPDESLRAKVEDAARQCPVQAITVQG